MNTELLRRIERIDPALPDDQIPDGVWGAEETFEELRQLADVPDRGLVINIRRRRLGWAVAVASAIAALVLIGGVAWLIRMIDPTEETPVVDQVEEPDAFDPADPPDLPADADTGTIAMPGGMATWVQISGDQQSLPFGPVIPWPGGVAVYEAFWQRPLSDPVEDPRLWVSSNGVDWRLAPLPVSVNEVGGALAHIDGVSWLIASNVTVTGEVTRGPARLWRSPDGANWEEIDLTAVVPPDPAGFVWEVRISTLASVDDLTVARVEFSGTIPFRDFVDQSVIACDPAEFILTRREPGLYSWRAEDCGSGVFRFQEQEAGLLVFDHESGEELGEVGGTTLSHIDAVVADNDISDGRLLIIDDGEVTQTESPWTEYGVTLSGFDDGIYAFVAGDGANRVWRSGDGRSWTELGPAPFDQDASQPRSAFLVSLSDGALWALTSDAIPAWMTMGAWMTKDGVTWESVPDGRPDETYPMRLSTGWFANNGSDGWILDGDRWWMHADDTWISLEDLGMDRGGDCAPCIVASGVGNTTFFSHEDSLTGRRELWLLTYEPSG